MRETVTIEISKKTFEGLEIIAEKAYIKPDWLAEAVIRHFVNGELVSEAAARVIKEVEG